MQMDRPHAAFGRTFDQLDVVVIDDAKPMQTILRSMLNSFRVMRVRTFDNPRQAMQSMVVDPPNLVITDWHMAPVDGIALIHTMRAERMGDLALVPTIIVTADPTRRLVEASVRVSAHAVLAKPLAPSTLQKRIESIIADGRMFHLQETTGEWMLRGTEEVLEAQRSRWQQFHAAKSGYTEILGPRTRPVEPEKQAEIEVVAEAAVEAEAPMAPMPKRPEQDRRPKKVTGLGTRRYDPQIAPRPERDTGQGDGKAA